jgi:hypothetical protein
MSPVNKPMMSSMKKTYGKNAKNIYFATENKMRKNSPKEANKVFGKKGMGKAYKSKK